MKLTRLTEIKSSSSGYDAKTKNVVSTYVLKSVYINPSYVIFMKSNSALEELSQRRDLVEGMNRDVPFTQVALSSPGMAPTMINVVGSPEQLVKKLKE